MRVKVDGQLDGRNRFVADKVRIRRNQDYRERKIVGPITEIHESTRGLAELVVLGLSVVVDDATELVGRGGRSLPIVRGRLGVVDEDDLLFTSRKRMGRHVAMAGELRLGGELVSNPHLDDERQDDELSSAVGGIIGFAADLGPVFAYAEAQGAREYLIYGEDDFASGEEDVRVGEAYIEIRGLLARWFAVAIGRQKFNEEREWYYNRQNLDAIRLVAETRNLRVEASVSRDLFDETRNPRDQDLLNTMLYGRYVVNDDLSIEGFYVDREDRTELDDSQTNSGVRILAEPGRHLELWADLSRLTGSVCTRARLTPSGLTDSGQRCGREEPTSVLTRDVRAHAFDVGGTYRPRVALDPSLTLAYAFGSGEDDSVSDLPIEEQAQVTSTSYRQTGLERNRGRYNGVVSFRYYGQVLDPALTNLAISTIGVGIRPKRVYSIDLIHHRYRQDEASRAYFDFGIDEDPNGESRDIGEAWDLILGYEPSRRLELRLNAGVFLPGAAFDPSAESATLVRFQSKFRF